MPTTVAVFNRQRMIPVKVPALQDFARRALSACVAFPGRKPNALADLAEVSVMMISDRRMAELHRRFLQKPGPTDVITFQHGEIFVSAETAQRQARAYRTSLEHELRLYIAHGLLHLRGYDDKTPAGAAEMKRLQERVVASLL